MNNIQRTLLASAAAVLALSLLPGCAGSAASKTPEARRARMQRSLAGTWVAQSGAFQYIHFSPEPGDHSRGWLQTEAGNRYYNVTSARQEMGEMELTLTDSVSETRNATTMKVELSTNEEHLRVTRERETRATTYRRTTAKRYYDEEQAPPSAQAVALQPPVASR